MSCWIILWSSRFVGHRNKCMKWLHLQTWAEQWADPRHSLLYHLLLGYRNPRVPPVGVRFAPQVIATQTLRIHLAGANAQNVDCTGSKMLAIRSTDLKIKADKGIPNLLLCISRPSCYHVVALIVFQRLLWALVPFAYQDPLIKGSGTLLIALGIFVDS